MSVSIRPVFCFRAVPPGNGKARRPTCRVNSSLVNRRCSLGRSRAACCSFTYFNFLFFYTRAIAVAGFCPASAQLGLVFLRLGPACFNVNGRGSVLAYANDLYKKEQAIACFPEKMVAAPRGVGGRGVGSRWPALESRAWAENPDACLGRGLFVAPRWLCRSVCFCGLVERRRKVIPFHYGAAAGKCQPPARQSWRACFVSAW